MLSGKFQVFLGGLWSLGFEVACVGFVSEHFPGGSRNNPEGM